MQPACWTCPLACPQQQQGGQAWRLLQYGIIVAVPQQVLRVPQCQRKRRWECCCIGCAVVLLA